MRCKYFFILIIILCFVFVPKVYAAENLTGAWSMYNQNTFHSVLLTGYDTISSGVSFPSSSYTQIGAANLTEGTYHVVTQMQLQPSYTFIRGNDYTMNYHFDFGSYIYPYWPTSTNNSWFFQSCPGSNCNLSYVWQGDSSHQQTSSLDLTISFRATSDSNSAIFTLGNTTDDKGTFYNAYTSQQGIRISSANITEVSNQIDLEPIIDNQNQNTQDIIDNQNAIAQQQEELQKVCSTDSINITKSNKSQFNSGLLNNNGSIGNGGDLFVYTNYYEILQDGFISISTSSYGNYSINYCLYDNNKDLISCSLMPINTTIQVPVTQNGFIRFSAYVGTDNANTTTIIKFCKNGNQALNDLLLDDGIGATVGSDFTSNFIFYDNDNFSTIITSPLVFLHSLSDTCTPVVLPLFGHNITLPCGTTVFWERNLAYVDTFRGFWNILFGGLIIYRLTLTLIMHVNDALDPTKDKIGGFDI